LPVTPELLLDCRADLGEVPIWHPERRLVSWVDIQPGRVNWLGLDGVAHPSLDVGRRVGAAVPTTDGALVVATDEGFARLEQDGTVRVIAEVENDGRDSFLNDGKCDALGRFWAGTIGVGEDGLAVADAGSLYRLDPDGEVTRVLTSITLSNGMDWTPDGGTFYYIDSGFGVDAFDFDLASGALKRRRRIVEMDPKVGFSDGMCLDVDDGLWTAIWGAGRGSSVHDGRHSRQNRPPAGQPADQLHLRRDERDVLVITTARHGLSTDALASEPHAGSVFCCRPGTTGRLTHAFSS
jgi:sugar lactone lactonase YvrE